MDMNYQRVNPRNHYHFLWKDYRDNIVDINNEHDKFLVNLMVDAEKLVKHLEYSSRQMNLKDYEHYKLLSNYFTRSIDKTKKMFFELNFKNEDDANTSREEIETCLYEVLNKISIVFRFRIEL